MQNEFVQGRIPDGNAALVSSASAILAGAGLALTAATGGELGGLDLLRGQEGCRNH